MTRNGLADDLLVSLSVANLMLLGTWTQLLPYRPALAYYLHATPANSYLGAILTTVVLACGIVVFTRVAGRIRRLRMAVWPLVFGSAALTTLNGSRRLLNLGIFDIYASRGRWAALTVVVVLTLIATLTVVAFVRWRHRVTQARRMALVFLPFVLVTFGSSIFAVFATPHAREFAGKRTEPDVPSPRTRPAVVWMIFDELDYRIAFDQRPDGFSLPHLDALVRVAVTARAAYAPANLTDVSIPSLLAGRRFTRIDVAGPRQLTARDESGAAYAVNTSTTVFGEFAAKDTPTAAFGWYHPYCRIFEGLSACAWYPSYLFATADSALGTTARQLRSLLELPNYSPFGWSLPIANHIATIRGMREDTRKYLRKGQGGFTFLHSPVPHGPYVYRRETDSFGLNRDLRAGYLDQLTLVDVSLGEARRAMEEAGTWQDALVIVSSDHHLRQNPYDRVVDRRVPFIVKLPRQNVAVAVEETFETVRTRDLIGRVTSGDVQTAAELAAWMRRHR